MLRGEDHMEHKRDGDGMLYSIGLEAETEGEGVTATLTDGQVG